MSTRRHQSDRCGGAPSSRTAHARALGLTCGASGVLMLVLGALLSVHGDVPKDQWSYPQAPSLFLGSELVLGAAHLMTAAGFLGVLRLRTAPTTVGRIGVWLAMAGCAGLTAGEWTSAFIAEQSNDSTAATIASTTDRARRRQGTPSAVGHVWHGWLE